MSFAEDFLEFRLNIIRKISRSCKGPSSNSASNIKGIWVNKLTYIPREIIGKSGFMMIPEEM